MSHEMRWRLPRYWNRFSLRTMFAALTVLCLLLGWKAQHVHHQQVAIEAVRVAGGMCRYDDWQMWVTRWERPGSKPIALEYDLGGAYVPPQWRKVLPPEKSWLRRLIGDDWFANVDLIRLRGSQVTNQSLAELRPRLEQLPTLKRLELVDTSVTHDGLKHLAGIERLEHLKLEWTPVKIDDPGMERLLELNPDLQVSY